MASAKNYKVSNKDVDGSSARYYATLDKAVARFEEMVGYKVDNAIAEAYYMLADAGKPLPKINELRGLSAVAMFGNSVTFQAISDEALAAVDAAKAAAEAAAAGDFVVAAEGPAYDERDGVCGTRRAVLAGPFASQDQAQAALAAMIKDMALDEMVALDAYVAKKSEGMRRPALSAAVAAEMYEDLPF